MTKPIVAFHWLQVNGRAPEQQNRQRQEKQHQQPTTNTPETVFTKIKNKLKTGGK